MAAQVKNRPQRGFSLIELMIALVLGLFIIGGVLAVFIGSSASFNSNESLSRVQENGRFALEILAEDLRNTGNKGLCWNSVVDVINTADSDYEADAYDLNDPIKGWTDDAGTFFDGTLNGYKAGTDLFLVKHAAETSDASLSVDIVKTDTTFTINGGVVSGAIMLLSDAAGCDLFQNTAALNSSTMARATGGGVTIGNKTVAAQELSHDYSVSSGNIVEISKLSSTLYYIGSGTTTANALRGMSFDYGVASDQELVEGVTDMSVLYGIVSGAGPALGYSADANGGNWDDVVAVRVTLIVEDGDINQNFSTTVALRNRLR
ncbi:PilW family protein [Amphritea pacifica]|uniref:PilW family protein n=1 Tax=Amphritea pacifica TaxID=2811233 RepID=UPI0019624CC7|nr:PilW family protein [Amphritea pacifica]MBN1008035.1 PilW family protein [Amphritea pacifica]